MQILVKQIFSLTNKSKEELFVFSNTLKNETTRYAHENFPSLSNTQILQKQTFSKEIFFFIFIFIFIKHSKLWKNLILRSINSKTIWSKSLQDFFLRMFYLAIRKLRNNLPRLTNQSKNNKFLFSFLKMKSKTFNTSPF